MLKNGVLLAVAAVAMICGPAMCVPAAVTASTTQDYPPTPPPLPPEFGRAEALLRLAIELDAAARDVRRRVDRLCARAFGVEYCAENFGTSIPLRVAGTRKASRVASPPLVNGEDGEEIAAEAAKLAAEADAITDKASRAAAEAWNLARLFTGVSPITAKTAAKAAGVAVDAVEIASGAAKLARFIERAASAAISGSGRDSSGADDFQTGNLSDLAANNSVGYSANKTSDFSGGLSVNPATNDGGGQAPPVSGEHEGAGGEQAGVPAGEHGAPGHEDHACSGDDCASKDGDTGEGDTPEAPDAPEAAGAPAAPAGVQGGAQGGGGLPFTGAPMAALAAVGAGLLALAAGLLVTVRRRRFRPGRR